MVILMLSAQRIQGCKVSLSQLSSSAACTQAVAVSIRCSPGFPLLARFTLKPPNPVASGHAHSCGHSAASRELRCSLWGRTPSGFTRAFVSLPRITPRILRTVPTFSAGGWQNRTFSPRCWLGPLYLMLQEMTSTRYEANLLTLLILVTGPLYVCVSFAEWNSLQAFSAFRLKKDFSELI